jgi:signal peptidase I
MIDPHRKSSTRDTFESLIVTVILAIFGTTFVVQAYKIPTGSMENTLLIGDHLLVNKFCFADQPGWLRHVLPYRNIHRGDIVVFKFPSTEAQEEPGTHLVKRVIGLPGDHIPLPAGEVLPGSTLSWDESLSSYVKDGELVVPPDCYFVMGDNRENSWDSRFWGFVPRDLISGRPLIIYWSYETPQGAYLRTSFSDRLSQTGDLLLHFFTKTRWRRTFRLVR